MSETGFRRGVSRLRVLSGDEFGGWWGGELAKRYLTLRTGYMRMHCALWGDRGTARVGNAARALDDEGALAVPMQIGRGKD